jgi:anti-sigma factor RsiW
MNVEEARRLLDDFVDGTLPADRRAAVEGALAASPELRAELARLRALLVRTAALPAEIQPAQDLWPDVRVRIEARADPRLARSAPFLPPERLAWPVRFQRWLHGARRPALAMAAVAGLFLAGAYLVLIHRLPGEGRSIVDNHTSTRPASSQPLAESESLATLTAHIASDLQQEYRLADAGDPAEPPLAMVGEPLRSSLREHLAHELSAVDRAVAEVRQAWESEPLNLHLAWLLASVCRSQALLQQEAVELAPGS